MFFMLLQILSNYHRSLPPFKKCVGVRMEKWLLEETDKTFWCICDTLYLKEGHTVAYCQNVLAAVLKCFTASRITLHNHYISFPAFKNVQRPAIALWWRHKNWCQWCFNHFPSMMMWNRSVLCISLCTPVSVGQLCHTSQASALDFGDSTVGRPECAGSGQPAVWSSEDHLSSFDHWTKDCKWKTK